MLRGCYHFVRIAVKGKPEMHRPRLLSALLKTGIFLLVVMGVVEISTNRGLVFDRPEEGMEICRKAISRNCGKDGLVRAISFDGPFLRDWATGRPVPQTETEAVQGVRDGARRFRLAKDSFLDPDLLWSGFPTNGFSLFLRLRIFPDAPCDQDICYSERTSQKIGLTLRDGELCFFLPSTKGSSRLASPFPMTGEYVSALVVLDGAEGKARLFLDGELRDEKAVADLRFPRSHVLFRTETWHPIQADLDEFAVWIRPFSASEIRQASQPGFQAAEMAAGPDIRRYRSLQRRGRILQDSTGFLDRFRPSRLRSEDPSLPLLKLKTGTSTRRKMARAHEASLANGERTRKAAELRTCRMEAAGRTHTARVCLDDVYSEEDRSLRPSYVVLLDDLPEAPFRLYPPENHLVLHRADPVPLPVDREAYVRLSVDGAMPSIYCMEPLERRCNARLSDFRPTRGSSPALASPLRPLSEFELLDAEGRARLLRDRVRLVLSDPQACGSAMEWEVRIEKAQKESQAKTFRPPALSELDALGENESPYWIETDLALTNAAFASVARWRSSRPDLIDAAGRVHRPDGDLPQVVELAPETADGTPPPDVPVLRFRVVPEKHRLPALMVSVSTPVSKLRRTDFIARYHPAGGGDVRLLRGMGGTGGGIRHRGNTSYLRSIRKPFSLKFDEPHGLLGEPWSRTLRLYSGYMDATLMRNRLSMDSFQAMAEGGGHHEGERFGWLELFVNGQYYGVYEAGTQDGRETLPPDSSDELFKLDIATALFREHDTQPYLQLLPRMEVSSREESLRSFQDAILDPSDDAFLAWAQKSLDVRNLVDFMLLLNFTGNYDGQYANLCIGREGMGARRYYLVPRDYDRSFLPDKAGKWMGNPLEGRLRRLSPEFRDALASRWSALRQGTFSEEAVGRLVDSYASELDGYMEETYRLLGQQDVDFPAEVRSLRENALERLRIVDQKVLPNP